MTYLVMAGSNYYPSPDFDEVRVAASREEAERAAADLYENDYVIVFEIDAVKRSVRRFIFPSWSDFGLKQKPWTERT